MITKDDSSGYDCTASSKKTAIFRNYYRPILLPISYDPEIENERHISVDKHPSRFFTFY